MTSRSRADAIWEDLYLFVGKQKKPLAQKDHERSLGDGFKHFSCFYLGEMIQFECFFDVFLTDIFQTEPSRHLDNIEVFSNFVFFAKLELLWL